MSLVRISAYSSKNGSNNGVCLNLARGAVKQNRAVAGDGPQFVQECDSFARTQAQCTLALVARLSDKGARVDHQRRPDQRKGHQPG